MENIHFDVCDINGCNSTNTLVELGASMFAKANLHLMNIAQEFNLSTDSMEKDTEFKKTNPSVGIWDGQTNGWHYLESPNDNSWYGSWASWFSAIKIIWKYGYSPIKASNIAKTLASKFVKIYGMFDENYTFTDITRLFPMLGVTETFEQTCDAYLQNKGVSTSFLHDFIAGITRNTYLQNTDYIHAFGCLIAVYSGLDEVYSISSGNFQMFERMLESNPRSTLNLLTEIKSIVKEPSGRYILSTSDGHSEEFDYVVMAAPITKSRIDFKNIDLSRIREPKYVKLYGNYYLLNPVTIITGQLNPKYFNLKQMDEIPFNVLTPNNAENIPFYTFSIKRIFNSTHTLVKMFSKNPISDSVLSEIYIGKFISITHAVILPIP